MVKLPPILRADVQDNWEMNSLLYDLEVQKIRFGRMQNQPLQNALMKAHHQQVFSVRTELRKWCPKYNHYLAPKGSNADFSVMCRSGQAIEGKENPPRRPGLCEQCLFYANGVTGPMAELAAISAEEATAERLHLPKPQTIVESTTE